MIISHNSYDFLEATVVPVIASFNSDSKIAPLYIKIAGETYKIHSFTERQQETWSLHFYVFDCKIVVYNQIKSIELTYRTNERLWTIPKIKM